MSKKLTMDRAILQIRIRKGETASTFVIEVWRLEKRKVTALQLFDEWHKISETPELARAFIDREFSRAFSDYKGDFESMVWEFEGSRELQSSLEQLQEEFRESKKLARKKAVH